MKRAILLDRDGVINVDRPDYVLCWDEFRFLPGALEALALAARSPYRIYVVTNQSAVGRGLLTRAGLDAIHRRMLADVAEMGGRIDGIFCCPHHPDDGCECRKPRPGLLERVAAKEGVHLGTSYLIGDTLRDLEAGQRAGCPTILVRTGYGWEHKARLGALSVRPVAVCDDLLEAVQWILEE